MIKVDRVGFEPTTSAMPMPYPTGLDDRPDSHFLGSCYDINTLVLAEIASFPVEFISKY